MSDWPANVTPKPYYKYPVFSNYHFIHFCLNMMDLQSPYWFGTHVQKCTESLLQSRMAMYPDMYTPERLPRYRADIAAKKIASDCTGGIKGYMWTNGGVGVLEAFGTDLSFEQTTGINGCPNKNADDMMQFCIESGLPHGDPSTIPEIVGLGLHRPGHTAYYIGNGKTVEWRGFKYGCVIASVGSRFDHWYTFPFLDYTASPQFQPWFLKILTERRRKTEIAKRQL